MVAEHYYSKAPVSKHQDIKFTETLVGRRISFVSDAGVFSKEKIDTGSLLLIEAMGYEGDERVLDWGCGIGPIGISAALQLQGGSVVMVDVNSRAVELARANLAANGITNAEVRQGDGYGAVAGERFDVILSNPPIRAGKELLFELISGAVDHLNPGGRLVLVARTSQGVKSLAKRMEEVFGNVAELEKGSGFRVIASTLGDR